MIDAAVRFSRSIAQAPFAARLGFTAGEIFGDAVTASLPYSPSLANAQGFVHGGVAASLSIWSAMLVAVASDRDAASSSYPVSFAISYLTSAREEGLHATARLAARGRDLAHAEIEIASDRGRTVAAALVVLRTGDGCVPVSAPAAAQPEARPEAQRLISPFSKSMGVQVRALTASSATLAMPGLGNHGPGGALDPGSMIAMCDTCAALACMPSLDERLRGSATLSLSAVFASPLAGPVVAIGRPVAENGAVRSALVEIGADDGEAGDADGRTSRVRRGHAMTACVSYRFLAADLRG